MESMDRLQGGSKTLKLYWLYFFKYVHFVGENFSKILKGEPESEKKIKNNCFRLHYISKHTVQLF